MNERDRLETAFRAAIYAVEVGGRPRQFLIGGSIAELAGEPFALLTAFNPKGLSRSLAANQSAQLKLEDRLAVAGHRWARGSAADVHGGHREPMFAVFGVSLEEAVGLAQEFGQAAIVWFDGERARLEGCNDTAAEAGP
jgi:hypothetical protein